ncbi:MAG: Histone H1-like protein HC1 [Chlamydiae bacterium]|nr:Histone H1-like protein HC1 [Chlamydiota bacterium]
MALKTTVDHLKKLLHVISHDLEKAGRGNKAAAQRVRTNTIKFAKTAKAYRKESITDGKKGGKKKKATKRKAAPRKKAAKKKTTRKKTVRKVTSKKTTARKKRRR